MRKILLLLILILVLIISCTNDETNAQEDNKQAGCIQEGVSLGAVILGNAAECCPGLEPYIPEGLVGTRGTCQQPGYVPEATPEQKLEMAKQMAIDFVKKSPTYAFDGSELTVDKANALACEGCYQIELSFVSSHAGYGDRTEDMVTQVITEHTAYLTITGGRVSAGQLDGKWDMIKQDKFMTVNLSDRQNST